MDVVLELTETEVIVRQDDVSNDVLFYTIFDELILETVEKLSANYSFY